MGLFDFLRSRPRNTAAVAAERLRIIVQQERAASGRPDYLPLLRRELLEVIRKYVNVDPDAIDIHVEREGDSEVLELSVALPEKQTAVPPPAETADEN
jgi:cell division topological specificity factor